MPLTNLPAGIAFMEQAANSGPQLLGISPVFTSATSLAGGRLMVTGLLAEDRISIISQGNAPGQIGVAAGAVSYGGVAFGTIQGGQGAAFTVQFGAGVTAEAVDALLERLAYANVSDLPTGTRTLTIDVRDAAGAGLAALGPLTPLTGSASPVFGFDLANNATPAFVDIDGDGDRDLVAGDNSGLFFTWRNTGTAAAPVFTAQAGTANPLNGLDAGTYSAPAFVDFDGDGDLDLVSGQGAGGLSAWRNTGTSAAPAFTALTDAANPFNTVTVGRGSAPAFLDLDGDGDLDLVSGSRYGTLLTWRNTGTSTAPVFTALTGTANPFNGIDIDLNSAPALVDLDGDGDLDLVSGENTGLIQAWRNTGTNAAPVFTALTGTANPFNTLDAGSYSKPAFADLDGDGDLDLVAGIVDGTFGAWLNAGSNVTPTILITVLPYIDSPTVTSGGAASFAENGTGVAYQATGTDPEGRTITWILGGTDAALFNMSVTTGTVTFKTAPNFEAPVDSGANNGYFITVTARNGGLIDATMPVLITVTNVNEAPSVTSAATASFAENGTGVAYQAAGSDPDAGTTLGWLLGGTDAALFDMDAATGAVTFKTTPNFETPADAGGDNTYDITVTASDGALSSAAHAVAITVTDANEAPSVTSAATASFAENGTGVAYQAAGSDPDVGTTLTWRLGGTDAALFNIDAASGAVTFKATPDFEAPADAGGDNTYDITVTASDGALSSAARAVAVTVTDANDAPGVTSAATASFAENGTGVAYQAAGSDPDAGTALSWTLGGADAAQFDISDAGAVTFKTAPDFEVPADAGGDNVYDITVTASDGTLSSAPQGVAITVTNVDDAPSVTSATTASFAENGTGLAYQATGSASGTGRTLNWTLGGTDAALFEISTGGAVSFKTAPDFEAPMDAGGDNVYDITVTASDGTLSSVALAVGITVTNVNEAPSVTSTAAASFVENYYRQEYQATGSDPDAGTTLTWALGGADAAFFEISESGAVTFKEAPNFEAPADAGGDNVYDITLTVSDGLLSSTAQAIAITVRNNNDWPLFTSGFFALFAENGTGIAYQATGEDEDAGTTLTWALIGPDAALFDFSSDGAVTFKTAPNYEAPADADRDFVYEIVVIGSDGVADTGGRVLIFVTNVNEAPFVTSGAAANFAENGTGPAYQVTFTDPDHAVPGPFPAMHLTLGGTDAELFEISESGAVSFKVAPDFEAPGDAGGDNIYDITVTAFDGALSSAAQAVAITVTPVNEAPRITSGAAASFAENGTNLAYQAIAADPDAGTTLSWSLAGTDAAHFEISASGAVTFRSTPNFEAAADADGDHLYDITVIASDETLSTSQAVSITVTNVNEAPRIISATTASVFENPPFAYVVSVADPDEPASEIAPPPPIPPGGFPPPRFFPDVELVLGGTDGALFEVRGGLVVFRTAPNFEAPADAGRDNVYNITITATDGELSSSPHAVAITVLDVLPLKITGTALADTLEGGTEDDTLSGLAGDDLLAGGIGADRMEGGTGDDTYLVDQAGDVVVELRNQGNDTVLAYVSWTLGAETENLDLLGIGDVSGTGNSLANQIKGNESANALDGGAGDDTLLGDAGQDTLTGGTGADSMEGGSGDDTYYVDNTSDRVVEWANGGTDQVFASVTHALAAHVEHLTLAAGTRALDGAGNDLANRIQGNDGANSLNGGAGDDTLIAGAGRDVLEGGLGADRLEGGSGDDTYFVDQTGDVVVEAAAGGTDRISATVSLTLGAEVEDLTLTGTADLNGNGNALANVITGNAGANTLNGGAGNDTLQGGAGQDTLDGNGGADRMQGGLGDDTYVVDQTGDVVEESAGGGTDSVQSLVTYTLGSDVENLQLTGRGQLNGTGNGLANRIEGNAEANALDGGVGNDTLIGGAGNDTLQGGDGADSMEGGAGDDTYHVNLAPVAGTGLPRPGGGTSSGNPGDVIVEQPGGGRDRVISSTSWTLGAQLEELTLSGSASMTGRGNDLSNALTGGSGRDTLFGEAGNDTLDGGLGIDSLAGGAGDDTYVVESTGEATLELAGGGLDRVNATLTWTLAADIEQLTLLGSASINGTGNALANRIEGNAGANRLDGGVGADTLIGGAGNDTYVVDSAADSIEELAGGGRDSVLASITTTLAAEVESLTLTGTANLGGTGNALNNEIIGNTGANSLAGDAGNDTLRGGGGNDALDGGIGIDSMEGGSGDDSYLVDNVNDRTIEAAGGGTDTVTAALNWLLDANVEHLVLTGTAGLAGTGNNLANRIEGNAGANRLAGFDGNDTLIGGAGRDSLSGGAGTDRMEGGADDDTYEVDATGDEVVELAEGGWDRVNASASWTMGAEVEELRLTGTSALNGTGNGLANRIEGNTAANSLDGGAGDDTLIGGAGNDTLQGGLGVDSLEGGAGNDTYNVDEPGGVMLEQAGGGTDRVNASLNWILDVEFEELTLLGTADLTGTGNDLGNRIEGNAGANDLSGLGGNDTLIGGAGNDTLDGGIGADRMEGGLGDDSYEVDHADDRTVEEADGGIDTVSAALNWLLDTNVEHLVLTGPDGLTGSGNTLNNRIEGNAGANRLNGLAGRDTLFGGAGNDTLDGGSGIDRMEGGLGDDTYEVNDFRDVVIEAADEGWDRINTSWSYSLRLDIEELILTGTANLSGGGNAQANRIEGNTGANSLNGGAGDDTLLGGAGHDTLEGGLGVDSLEGGAGDDTYHVDDLADVVVELAGGGTDRINATLSLVLAAEVEHLALLGAAALNGTGNDLGNRIEGNAGANQLYGLGGNDTLTAGVGNDTLDGGLGVDSMEGGAGDDTYDVDDTGDIVTEAPDAGTDRVRSAATFTLSAQVEQLVLTGTGNVSGTGNGLANRMEGNAGANLLSGEAGNDSLMGGAGADTLQGGAGNDTLEGGAGVDRLEGGDGDDTLLGLLDQDTLRGEAGNDSLDGGSGDDSMDGGAGNDSLMGGAGADTLQGGAGNDKLEGGTGVDRLEGGDGDDTYVVNSLDDTLFEYRGGTQGGTDRVNVTSDFPIGARDWTLSANIENLYLMALGNLNGTGNRDANRIEGNASANRLEGLNGNDTLIGGEGNDTLDGGAGTDSMEGGAGNDLYIVSDRTAIVVEAADAGLDGVQASDDWVLGEAVENLYLTGIATAGTGNGANNRLVGNDRGNKLMGLAGDDTLQGRQGGGNGLDGDNQLYGGTGDDSLVGGIGKDLLDGGTGADYMAGGVGDDRYYVDSLNDVVYETNDFATDLVYSSIDWTLSSWVEDLKLLYTSDLALVGTGNERANKIDGNYGDNRLFGLDGNDILNGDRGNDSLEGGAGNDTLQGGSGTDSLLGGAGADVFEFASAFSGTVDIIEDFSAADGDRIDLRGIDAKPRIPLDDAFTWIGSANFSNAAGQLRFSGGILAGDVNGDGGADFQITLTGITSLSASSIWL